MARQADRPAVPAHVRLGDIGDLLRGVTYKKEQARAGPGPGLIPILRATNIGERLTFDDLVYVPGENVNSEQLLRPGDIVIAASSGSRAVVGKSQPLLNEWEGSFGAFCYCFRPRKKHVEPRYVSYFMQLGKTRSRLSTLAAGININNLKREHIESIEIPLVPMGEQRRIVAALDSYFSRLDDVEAGLERVQRNLKRYRASVLQAAVTGRLVPTEADLARTGGRSYESATKLLARVRQQRGLASSDAQPTQDGANEQEILPEGWCWAPVGDISSAQNGRAFMKSEWRESGIPIVRIQNLKDSFAAFNYFDGELEDAFRVESGDLLFAWSGTPGTSFGAHIWSGGLGALNQHIFRLDFPAELVDSRYFALALNHNVAGYIAKAQGGVGLAHITKKKFMASLVPLPPLMEQQRIAEEFERQSSDCDSTAAALERQLRLIMRLRQSLLRSAFEGGLVGATEGAPELSNEGKWR